MSRLLVGDDGYVCWSLAKKVFAQTVLELAAQDLRDDYGPPDVSIDGLNLSFPVDVSMDV
jgi:hypothetical protein